MREAGITQRIFLLKPILPPVWDKDYPKLVEVFCNNLQFTRSHESIYKYNFIIGVAVRVTKGTYAKRIMDARFLE
jgi:hypothetical protein